MVDGVGCCWEEVGEIWGNRVKSSDKACDTLQNLYRRHENANQPTNPLNMRNLRNVRNEEWNPPSQYQGRPLTAATWDLANNSSFLCTVGPSEENALIELVRVNIKPGSQYYFPFLIIP
jgi:hypothetical protein